MCIHIYHFGFGAIFCRCCKYFNNDNGPHRSIGYTGRNGRVFFPGKEKS